jgi:hypothetical protein
MARAEGHSEVLDYCDYAGPVVHKHVEAAIGCMRD